MTKRQRVRLERIPKAPNKEWTPEAITKARDLANRKTMTPQQIEMVARVPKRPNKNWTSKDIREARKARRQQRDNHKPDPEDGTAKIAALQEQARARVQDRIVRNAFRTLLSNSRERRLASRAQSRNALVEYKVEDTPFDRRVADFTVLREAYPRITLRTIENVHTPSGDRRIRKYESLSAEREKELRKAMKAERAKHYAEAWKDAMQQVKTEMDERWPSPDKKQMEKDIVRDEIREAEVLEKRVTAFLHGDFEPVSRPQREWKWARDNEENTPTHQPIPSTPLPKETDTGTTRFIPFGSS